MSYRVSLVICEFAKEYDFFQSLRKYKVLYSQVITIVLKK